MILATFSLSVFIKNDKMYYFIVNKNSRVRIRLC